MKVVVYGKGNAPRGVQAVQSAQVSDEVDLYQLMHELSGGPFVLVILSAHDEELALAAARVASPQPTVVLARGGQLQEVVGAGQRRPYGRAC